MSPYCTLVTAICSTLFVADVLADNASLGQMLEKGIYEEETAGNIDAAIEIYGQIAAKDKVEAPLAAQAYYRLGVCQLKQNKPDQAAATFNQLVERFPQQVQWVRKAKAELARMNKVSGPPKILRTTPAAFQQDVPATLDKVTVTFDQPMTDNSWSWTGGGETFPKTGKPSYNAARTTCSLPVTLEPGKVYWIGVNSPSHRNFVSVRGEPAQRYVILFATAGTDGKPTPIPDDMQEQARQINEAATAATPSTRPSSEPVVIETQPKALQNDVPPDLDKITVTFDQPMHDRSWSWTGGGDTYPEVTASMSYDAERTTCTMPVKLQPGKVYWVGINSPSHRNFKSENGAAARRYVILFATAGTDGKPTSIPPDMAKEARRINAASAQAAASAGKAPVSAVNKRKAQELAARGWQSWNQQKWSEAEDAFQQSLKLDATNPHAWNGLGWTQFNSGKAPSAQESFGKALALEPKHAGALNGMAWVSKNNGKTDQAIEYWKKAVQAMPTASASLAGLAQTYMEQQDYTQAAKYYQQWLKAEPGNAEAKAGLEQAREKSKQAEETDQK